MTQPTFHRWRQHLDGLRRQIAESLARSQRLGTKGLSDPAAAEERERRYELESEVNYAMEKLRKACSAGPGGEACQFLNADGAGGTGTKHMPGVDTRLMPRKPDTSRLGQTRAADLSAAAETSGGALAPPARQKCGGDCGCAKCRHEHQNQKGTRPMPANPVSPGSHDPEPHFHSDQENMPAGGKINVGENEDYGPPTGPEDHEDAEPFGAQVTKRLHEWCRVLLEEGTEMARHLEHKPTAKLLAKKLQRILDEIEEIEGHHDAHYPDTKELEGRGISAQYRREQPQEGDEEELALGEGGEGDEHDEEEPGAMREKSLFGGKGEDGHSGYSKWRDRPSHRTDGRDEDFGVEDGHEPGVIHHVQKAGAFLKEIGEGRPWNDDARKESREHLDALRELVDMIDADEEESDLGEDEKKLPKGDALAEFGRGKEDRPEDDDEDEDGGPEHPGLKAIKDSHRLLAEVGMKPELEDEHRDRARKLGAALTDYHTKKDDGSDDEEVEDAKKANEKSLLAKAVKVLKEQDRRRGVMLTEIGSKLGGVLDHLNGVANAGAEQQYLQGMAARSLGPTLLGGIRQKALERKIALAKLRGEEVPTAALMEDLVGRLGLK